MKALSAASLRIVLTVLAALLVGLLTLNAAPVAAEEGGGPDISAAELPVVSVGAAVPVVTPELLEHARVGPALLGWAIAERRADLPVARTVRVPRWFYTTTMSRTVAQRRCHRSARASPAKVGRSGQTTYSRATGATRAT